jgi:hypothetical protein
MSESWDGERGDLFMTLTFDDEPYEQYNHYEWYEAQYGDLMEEEEWWYEEDYYYDEDYSYYYTEEYYYSEEYYYYTEEYYYSEDYYYEEWYEEEWEEEEEVLAWADYAEAEVSELWYAVQNEYSGYSEDSVEADMPYERGLWLEIIGVDEDGSCQVSGEGVEDMSLGVYGIAGPYENDDGEWTCGAVVYTDYSHIGGEHQIIMHDGGSNYMIVDVSIIHFVFDTFEDTENSSFFEYVADSYPVSAWGYAGALVYMDIPRDYIGILYSVGVDEDGDCSLTGEGIDSEFVEVIATVGPDYPPSDDETLENFSSSYICAVVVATTDNAWTDDEFDVYVEDGNDANILNVKISIVNEDDIEIPYYDEDYNYSEYYYDEDYSYDYSYDYDYSEDYYYEEWYEEWEEEEWNDFETLADYEEMTATEGWLAMEERGLMEEFSGSARDTIDVSLEFRGGAYVTMTGVGADDDCRIDGDAPVAYMAGPYFDDDEDDYVCGVFVAEEIWDLYPTSEFMFYLSAGANWMGVNV